MPLALAWRASGNAHDTKCWCIEHAMPRSCVQAAVPCARPNRAELGKSLREWRAELLLLAGSLSCSCKLHIVRSNGDMDGAVWCVLSRIPFKRWGAPRVVKVDSAGTSARLAGPAHGGAST